MTGSRLKREVARIIPAHRLAASDSLRHVVATPDSFQEVSQLVAYAGREGVPVLPFAADAPSVRLDAWSLRLDLDRLSSIADYSPDSGLISVQAGVRLDDLGVWLMEKDRSLGVRAEEPANPRLWDFLLSPKAGRFGPRFGCKWDQVLSMSAVLPSGRVFRNSAAPARATGPDFSRSILMAGGRLGIPLEVHLRVHRIPTRKTLLTYELADPLAGVERAWQVARDVNPVYIEVGITPRARKSRLPHAFLAVELWEHAKGLGIHREQVRKLLADVGTPAELPEETLLDLEGTYDFDPSCTRQSVVDRDALAQLIPDLVQGCPGRVRMRLRGFVDNQVCITYDSAGPNACALPAPLVDASYLSTDAAVILDRVASNLDPAGVFQHIPKLWR
jgi:FAD/FMN-containing dehydrogenase